MKIAAIASGHIPSQWAHSITTMKMANAFYRLGYEVEVLTVERFFERRQRQKVKDIYKFYGISDGIKISYFKDKSLFYFRGVIFLKYFLSFFEKISNNIIRFILDPEKKISKYCKKNNIDLCYCRTYRAAYYNIKNNLPTVIESHTPNVKYPDLQRLIKLSSSEYFKGLVTISEILKKKFIKAGIPASKILVIQDGVDVDSFKNLLSKKEIRKTLGISNNKKIIVYCGSLFPDKGIEYVLLVAKNIPEVVFLLVGGHESQIKMWKNIARTKKVNNLQFEGFVGNRDVPLYLKAADALIMPYKTVKKTKIMDINTTSPLKLFEYMAAKRPIVSINISAISRTVTNYEDVLLAEPDNIQQLTEFVRLILSDRNLAMRLADSAYGKIHCYDWKNRCRRIIDWAIKI